MLLDVVGCSSRSFQCQRQQRCVYQTPCPVFSGPSHGLHFNVPSFVAIATAMVQSFINFNWIPSVGRSVGRSVDWLKFKVLCWNVRSKNEAEFLSWESETFAVSSLGYFGLLFDFRWIPSVWQLRQFRYWFIQVQSLQRSFIRRWVWSDRFHQLEIFFFFFNIPVIN